MDPNNPTAAEKAALTRHMAISEHFWERPQQDASGFIGAKDHFDQNGTLSAHSTTSRFLIKNALEPPSPEFAKKGAPGGEVRYEWFESAVCTFWTPHHGMRVLVQLEREKQPVLEDVISGILEPPTSAHCLADPYVVYVIILGQLVKDFDSSVWSWRHWIRVFEKKRSGEKTRSDPASGRPDLTPEPDYERMHEVARHIIHCTEMLATIINVLESLIEEHRLFVRENYLLIRKRNAVNISRNVAQDLRMQLSILKGYLGRSKALEARLDNEVNLAFAAVNQHDSRTAVKIAEATQADSASTKTIAFLGLIFLPGTFVSSIFSTTFFTLQPAVDLNGSNGSAGASPSDSPPPPPRNRAVADLIPSYWIVSDRFWIFWACTLPLTAFTIVLWSVWQHFTNKRHPTASHSVHRLLKAKAACHPTHNGRVKYMKKVSEMEKNYGKDPEKGLAASSVETERAPS